MISQTLVLLMSWIFERQLALLAQAKIPSDDLRVGFNSVIKAEIFWPQLPNKEPTSWKSVIENHEDRILAMQDDLDS